MSSPAIPSFWIRLRPEHIDQNTDSFLAFLSARRANAAGDPALAESFSLLEERCTQIWSSVTSSFPGDTDEAALRLGARLFGARTLLKSEDNRECSRKAFAQMLHCLACLVPSQTVPLVRVLSRAVTCREVLSTGFGWKNITGGDSPEVIAAVILAGAEFSGETLADRWFENEGRGAVHVSLGRIGAWPVNRDSARINALPVGFSHGTTGTQAHLPVKVKTADKRDFTRLDAVIRSFMNAAESLRPSPPPALLRYVDGDVLPVRYLSTDRFGNMVVESADAEHERVTGIIRKDMPAVRTYTCDDLTELLEKGDVFLAKWNARNSRFMLQETLSDYMMRVIPVGSTVTALCKGDNGFGRLLWITDRGFPVTTAALASYKQGDYALMSVESVDDKGTVRTRVMRHTGDTFSEDDARQEFLCGFCRDTPDFREVRRREDTLRDGTQLQALARTLLLVAANDADAPARRETLVTALLLARCCGDTEAETYGRLCLGHLRNVLLFMEDMPGLISCEQYDAPAIRKDSPSVSVMMVTDLLLKIYSSADPDGSPAPEDLDMKAFSRDSRLVKLLSLLAAERQVRGIVPSAALASIRRTIYELLNVSREDYEGMDIFGYLGPESGMQEYKSSFLIAPKDASEQNQCRTIFKVIDAFLNSETGGTLYLGVNDDGYVCGLEEDMRMLERQDSSKKGMDGLLRAIRQQLETAFPQEVYMTLAIRPVFDDRAVRIDIPPYAGGVVETDGTAWIRFGPECVRMSETLREKIERKRQESRKEN